MSINHPADRPGIIPARAGFTDWGPGAGSNRADHPRSRGVYAEELPLDVIVAGSSPLARGLLFVVFAAQWARGIIPARAGFTDRDVLGLGALEDHPRSRGVYRHRLRRGADPRGSSPLARGLLTDAEQALASLLDHPRSRGVYSWSGAPSRE